MLRLAADSMAKDTGRYDIHSDEELRRHLQTCINRACENVPNDVISRLCGVVFSSQRRWELKAGVEGAEPLWGISRLRKMARGLGIEISYTVTEPHPSAIPHRPETRYRQAA